MLPCFSEPTLHYQEAELQEIRRKAQMSSKDETVPEAVIELVSDKEGASELTFEMLPHNDPLAGEGFSVITDKRFWKCTPAIVISGPDSRHLPFCMDCCVPASYFAPAAPH